MPGSTYSTNLKVELMATGENSGTWGDITNTNLGTALEQAIVGYGNPDYASDANLTISITNSNAAQAARALVLNVTSSVSLTATRELVVPTIQKQYIVQNNTTGSQSITVKTSAGTGITVPNGRKAHLYVNGTDVIQMFDFVDINGGAIDGTPIGASSASTGAFTTLNASGATTLDGNVTLGNASGDNVTVTGTITSNLLFTDNTYDIGASGATRPRNLFLAGAATIGGNLSVGGTLTLTGGVNLNGNVTVGDNSSDTLTINSTITSNLLFTDNTYDIGASGATRPRNLFLAGNATIGGNQTLTGSLTVDSTTDSSSTTTGSIQTDGGLGVAKALYVGTNVNIGGLTASKGVFTDASKNLTSTGTLGTDQGGTGLTSFTANGVVYASSSSALATGSSLTFDGTILTTPRINITNTGTGATFSSSGGSGLRIYGSSGTNQWDLYLNGANVRFSDNTGGGVVKIDTGAVIDGNVGIGAVPTQKFEVYKAAGDTLVYGSNPRLVLTAPTGINGIRVNADTTPLELLHLSNGSQVSVGGNMDMTINAANATAGSTFKNSPTLAFLSKYWNGSASASQMQGFIGMVSTAATTTGGYFGLGIGSADAVRINSSGNVGIGISPSYALDVKASGVFNVARFAGQLSSVSTYIYTDTAYWAFGDGATYTGQLYGGHAINKTLSMYTDSVERVTVGATGNVNIRTGNLAVGYTGTPAANLDVRGSGAVSQYIISTSASSQENQLVSLCNNGAGYSSLNLDGSNIKLRISGSNKVGIDSTGLGVGIMSPTTALDVTGSDRIIRVNSSTTGGNALIRYSDNGTAKFSSGWNPATGFIVYDDAALSYRMIITTSGNLLIGDTNLASNFRAGISGNANALILAGTGGDTLMVRSSQATSPSQSIASFFSDNVGGINYSSGTLRFNFTTNGGLANYQANDTNLSDRREKTNFAPAKSYLDTICAIPVQTFNYIDQSEDDPGLTLGVVAQDVQAVAPELVAETNWGTKDNPKMRLSIYQTDLQYALMKALQELKAEFDAYKASHP